MTVSQNSQAEGAGRLRWAMTLESVGAGPVIRARVRYANQADDQVVREADFYCVLSSSKDSTGQTGVVILLPGESRNANTDETGPISTEALVELYPAVIQEIRRSVPEGSLLVPTEPGTYVRRLASGTGEF